MPIEAHYSAYNANPPLTILALYQSTTGYFTQLGRCDLPFIYHIQTVRNGRGFCVRTVNVTQEEGKGICFSCHCSFKRPEPGSINWQERVNMNEKYGVVLDGVKSTWEMEEAPSVLDMAR
jgi:hypothetical protein